MFKTISENSTVEIVEKKSKFIANIFCVKSQEEAENYIKEISKKYHDARHNCYAYSIFSEDGLINKFSDDGEPSGTAGAPILNIIISKEITNILVIVTRYFGGILLGTGGLVRAYSEATNQALEKVNIIQKDYGLEVMFETSYSDLEKMKYYFKQNNITIVNTIYEEKIKIMVEITDEKLVKILENRKDLNFKFEDYKILQKKIIQFVE